jgi:2-dehydropantoate 2-reductase
MSGNFPQILWRECLSGFENLGVPHEAFTLYLQKNIENFTANPKQSLTGPLARNDVQTIEKNLAALPPSLKKLYQAFVDFYCGKKAI